MPKTLQVLIVIGGMAAVAAACAYLAIQSLYEAQDEDPLAWPEDDDWFSDDWGLVDG